MDRDGNPRSFEEDPINQTGPLSIKWNDEPERAHGDVLSDGWTPGHDPADANPQTDDSPNFDAVEGRRRAEGEFVESHEEADDDYERPEGFARLDDDEWNPGTDPDDGEPRRGFLGSGWTGDNDAEEERSSQNKRLFIAIAAIVVLAIAGGWIVSSSVGSTPEAACAVPAGCSSTEPRDPGPADSAAADPSADPGAEQAVTPGATTEAPSPTPTTEPTSSARTTREPSSRPSPTRSRVRSPQPSPRSSTRTQDPDDEPRIEDEPTPTPTSSSPAPPPTTQAPQPTPTETKNGGLFDWLF